MSNALKRMRKRIKKSFKEEKSCIENEQNNDVIVHGAMRYKCEKCGREWWMFLEKGIEEFGENHKPSPFIITCKCGGRAMDISGIRKLPEGYQQLPSGASYFANRKKSDCGVPILI